MNSHWTASANRPTGPEPADPLPRRRAVAWKTSLALVAAAVLILPVVLLPLTTGVPILVWLPLLLVALAVLVWLVVRRRQPFASWAAQGFWCSSRCSPSWHRRS